MRRIDRNRFLVLHQNNRLVSTLYLEKSVHPMNNDRTELRETMRASSGAQTPCIVRACWHNNYIVYIKT